MGLEGWLKENERFVASVLKIMTLQQRSVLLKLLTRKIYQTTTFKVKIYVDKVIYPLHVELGHVDKWTLNKVSGAISIPGGLWALVGATSDGK
jgi:hypothetical protein